MIFKILFLIFFITFGDSVRDFNGFTVYRIKPQTNEQLEYLRKLSENKYEIDFWTEPTKIGQNVDVMVGPKHKTLIEDMIKEKSFDYEIMIKDLEKLLNEVKREPKIVDNRAVDGFFENFQRLSVIQQFVNDIIQENPSIATKEVYGQSTEGRELSVLKLQVNSSPNKPIIFIDSLIHAREWIATTTNLWFVQTLIDGLKNSDSAITQLFNDFDFYFVAVVNPDGYEYSHTNNRMWRKTRSTISSTSCPGVDANRNFNHNWTTIGSSSNPCSDTFHGSAAFSEPETKALSDYILKIANNIKLYVAMHSYGQYMLSPWGWSPVAPPTESELLAKSGIFINSVSQAYGTKYVGGSSATTLYPNSGSARDWSYGVANVPYSYTLELRDTGSYGFALPPSFIQPTGIETAQALIAMIQAIGQTLKI